MTSTTVESAPQSLGYFNVVTGLIRQPHRFFGQIPLTGIRAPLKILAISAVFHAAVSFTYVYGRSVPLTLILLANAMAIPFIMGGLAWMLQSMIYGRGVGFDKMFAVFAYASSVTLLFSWVPALGLLTEPWRLFIAVAGLAKGCDLGWKRGVILVVASVLLFLMLIWSAMPVLVQIKELFA
ncbi:MAG: hypothetical protein PWQ57_3299 [Desulfovibrionales bacterium]|jgi:hypothetical protein|nr:hypothetical protein [Desulfovibrionales bacterium]